MAKINVTGMDITVIQIENSDYISLTDMARNQMGEHLIIKWLSLKNTIEYIGEWEALFNPRFNCTEFGTIKNSAGSNNFVLSAKQWLERTGAIGITASASKIQKGRAVSPSPPQRVGRVFNELRKRTPFNPGGGEKQLLAFACAMVHNIMFLLVNPLRRST